MRIILAFEHGAVRLGALVSGRAGGLPGVVQLRRGGEWTAEWKQDMQFPAMLLKDLARFEPEAVEPLVARLPAPGFSLPSKGLGYIARENPALAARLASKLGETLPEDRGAKYQAVEDDPVGTCDAWLAALQKMPPENALEACGLEARQAGRLAGFMTQVYPEKAKALAAKVPWESLKISTGSVPEAAEQDMRRLWKAPAGDKADARGFLLDGSLDTLQSDPARYAASVDPSGA